MSTDPRLTEHVDYNEWILTAYKRFAAHADACEICSKLARGARRYPARPAPELVQGCCAIGRPMAVEWVAACEEYLRLLVAVYH